MRLQHRKAWEKDRGIKKAVSVQLHTSTMKRKAGKLKQIGDIFRELLKRVILLTISHFRYFFSILN